MVDFFNCSKAKVNKSCNLGGKPGSTYSEITGKLAPCCINQANAMASLGVEWGKVKDPVSK